MGTFVPQATESVVAILGDPSMTAQLYAALTFTEMMGTILGGLTSARLFGLGLNLDTGSAVHWGMGLPFWISAVSFLPEGFVGVRFH